ncbi:MAG: hypothetical protein K9M45_12285 [Kiritimatiellales bacterium]|nr:hypothetical protein [Kiritimatiellales bacterium]
MVNFRINLAKSCVSLIGKRHIFYKGMILYVLLCAAALVYLSYTATLELVAAYKNRNQRQLLFNSISSAPPIYSELLRNPARTYQELEKYSKQIGILDQALSGRVDFLPILHLLLADLPQNIRLESLNAVAGERTISFSLQVPLASSENGDYVRALLAAWNANPALMAKVGSIRPVTGERRSSGDKEVFLVKFICALK